MEYDQFSVVIEHADEGVASMSPPEPGLVIHFDGSYRQLQRDLQARSRTDVNAADIDIAIRNVSSSTDDRAILTLSDSVTGTYLLECELDPATLNEFINAVQTYTTAAQDDPSYLVRIETKTDQHISFRAYLLLVYRPDGILCRDWSLIPADAEV